MDRVPETSVGTSPGWPRYSTFTSALPGPDPSRAASSAEVTETLTKRLPGLRSSLIISPTVESLLAASRDETRQR